MLHSNPRAGRRRQLFFEPLESRALLAALSPAIAEDDAIAIALGSSSSSQAPIGPNDFRISDMGPNGNPDHDALSAAVAYNSTNNEYLVVWSGNDMVGGLLGDEFEIHGQRINAATGAAVGVNDFRISDAGPNGNPNFDAFTPAVAYNSVNNQYLVIWVGTDNVGGLVQGEFEIFGQRLTAAGALVGANDFRISDMGPNGNTNFRAALPDVAYSSVNNQYLVVWQGDDVKDEEFEVFGQRINAANGAAVGTNDFRISDMGPNLSTSFAAFTPAVAYNSTDNQYLVVWYGDDNIAPLVNDEFEVFGERLNAATGARVGANDFRISDMGPNGSTSFIGLVPDVVYNSRNNQYLVAWQGDDNIAPLVDDEFEIFGQRLSAAGAAVGTNDFRVSDMGPDGSTAFFAFSAALAYNSAANEYLVTWSARREGTFNSELEIFGQRLSNAGASLGENDFRISDMGPDGTSSFAAFTPKVAYNSANNQYLVVWHGDDDAGALVDDELEIFGQRLGHPAAAPQAVASAGHQSTPHRESALAALLADDLETARGRSKQARR